MDIFYEQTDIGAVGIAQEGGKIIRLCFADSVSASSGASRPDIVAEAFRQLGEYLAGKRRAFDLPLSPEGTLFQKKVWAELEKIPYGKTASYRDIASAIGNRKACRAVGMANNRNPIAIFIPCHRVIGADGSLIGYAGGLDIKRRLLELERTGRLP